MPIYPYRCKECHTTVDVTTNMWLSPLSTIDCPACGNAMDRVWTPPNIQVKDGTGAGRKPRK